MKLDPATTCLQGAALCAASPMCYNPADTLAPLLTQPLLLCNRARPVQQQPRQQLSQLQQVCVPRHPLQAWPPQEWLASP